MTIITDAMLRHYNDLVARADAETLQDVITNKGYDDAFKRLVLDAVSDDILLELTAGWVFWPWREDDPKGYWNAASLRVIADELDRRNEELFTDAV